MMSNIPKLRFPEFKGEWEEKKLSDFMTRLTRKNSNNESSRALTISSVDGLIDQGEFFKKQIASKDTSGYYLLKKGDFAYNKSYSVGYDYGSIKRLDRYEDGVVSTLYICMSLTSDTNSDYLTHYFDSMKWNKSVSEISAEGARNHGLLNIPTEAFFQTKHFLAPSSQEQQKIADFLSNVDSIITAETKILKTLQKKKKALMQKLFTQQLRFKSDDGTDFPAWEEKKFSEVFIYHQTNTFSRNMLNYEEGDTYNIHYGDILVKFGSYIDFDNSKIPFINSDVTLNKFVSDSFLKDGDIIIADTAEDESAGKVSEVYNINNKKALSGLHTILCRPKQIFASKYLGYFMNSNVYHKQIVKLLVGTKVLSINKSVIADTIIQIPCLAEQQKIADCLSSLDSLIQNQQKVVTTWQQRKKALLQQMFI